MNEELTVESSIKSDDNKYIVTFNNGCTEIFSETEVLEHYLYEGSVLLNINYEQLIKTIMKKRGIASIISYVSMALRTEKQTEDKLLRQGYDQETVCEIIEYIKNLGYIDDHEYARKYVNTCKKTKIISRRMCEYELVRKGVPEIIASRAVEVIDDKEQATKLVNKKMKVETDNLKLRKYLYSKGFTLDTINSILGDDIY